MMGVILATGIDQEDLLFSGLEHVLTGDQVLFAKGRLDSSGVELCLDNMIGLQQMISENMVVLGELAEKPGKADSKVSKLKTRNYTISGKRTSTVELTISGVGDKQREFLEGPHFSGAEISILLAPYGIGTMDPHAMDQHVVLFNGMRWTVDWSGEADGLWTVVISTEFSGDTDGQIYPMRISAVPDADADPVARTWVATDGSDTTGDGTYLRPYATLGKANSLTLTGSNATIFVKSGTYKENNTFTKAYTWRAFGGNVTLQNGTTSGGVINIGTDSKAQFIGSADSRFVFDAELGVSYLVNINTAVAGVGALAEPVFKYCNFIRPKSSGQGIYYLTGGSSSSRLNGFELEMEDCIFVGDTGSWIACNTLVAYPRDVGVYLNRCTFSGNCTSNVINIGNTNGDNSAASAEVSITNCRFTKCKTAHDIHIAKSGSYIINDNTWTYAESPKSSITAIKTVVGNTDDGITGTVVANGNTVDFGAFNTNTYAFKFSLGGIFEIEACENSFTIANGNTSFNGGCIEATDMSGVVIDGNNIDLRYANPASQKASILIANPTVELTGKRSVRDNILRSGAAAGYMMVIGADGPMANDNYGDGVIVSGNVFYGSRCYGDPASVNLNHSLLVGYIKDYIIAHNYFYGCRIGLVLEHDNLTDADAGSVIMNNVWVDCNYPVACGGMNKIRIYGNTIVNRLPQTHSMIAHGFNASMSHNITAVETHNGGTQTKITYASGYPPLGSKQLTVSGATGGSGLNGVHAIASIDHAGKYVIVNTAWSAGFASAGANAVFNITWNGTDKVGGLEVKNNVLYAASGADCALISANDGSEFAAGGCDYNLLYTSTPAYLCANADGQLNIGQWMAAGNDTHSVWDGTPGAEVCATPDIEDLDGVIDALLATPTADGNLVGSGVNLTEEYPDTGTMKHAILAGSEPPVTASKTVNQPEDGAWTIGAVVHG